MNLTNPMDTNALERVEISLLLEGIYRQYGYDFRNYSSQSIRRRIWHRMQAERLETVTSLLNLVLHDRNAMDRLFQDMSINVTEMFRDPAFFLTFRRKVIPYLRQIPLIRIWHAGCSTGEEVYSMCIILKEEGLLGRSQIYATDMNERVLEQAAKGELPLEKMQMYTKNYLQSGGTHAFSEYYTVKRGVVRFSPLLSENVVFSQHNLATDHSFNEFHVIVCRNVLIYFDEFLQQRVLNLFDESLHLDGYLGLGSKEGIPSLVWAGRYEEIEAREKMYRKIQNLDRNGKDERFSYAGSSNDSNGR
jgi:chemotaxis protein methyltransferase CheR